MTDRGVDAAATLMRAAGDASGVERGLHNMRDRIEAVGGHLGIVDTGGTRIVGRVGAAYRAPASPG